MCDNEPELEFNGVNGSTGRSLVPPLSAEKIVGLACGEKWDLEHLADLKETKERIDEDDMGMVFGPSAKNLHESGWGVIFTHDAPEELKKALAPLMELRRAQAGRDHQNLYRELVYRPRESKPKFLARYKVGPGAVDPEDLPYYLLIVGGPEDIPFLFQYQLDVQYAVGRIHFETIEEYAAYARSVVAVETQAIRRPRTMSFFGVSNRDDRATKRSLEHLVSPLAQELEEAWGPQAVGLPGDIAPWKFHSTRAADATKANLSRLLGGSETPALLFTASHGIGFDPDDDRLLPHQGALLCHDWPGPRLWRRAIPPEQYFSADDIEPDADLAGLITFHFACYGAGTPKFDDYAHRESTRRQLAPESFVARLPRRLLAHPEGGALATVGHIDRAWSYSFDWVKAGSQLGIFTSVFGCLFDGYPIGAATEYFNQRYAELSSDLSAEIEGVNYGMKPDLLSLSGMWTANNDARSYVVIGDPAVRLAVD